MGGEAALVEGLPYGEPGLLFRDFRWRIGNRLLERDGGSRSFGWHGLVRPNTQGFTEDFDLLATPVSLRHTAEEVKAGPMLVFRARWRPDAPKLRDIELEEEDV